MLIVVQNVTGIEVDKQLSCALDILRTDQKKRIISVWASALNPIMVSCNRLGSEFACECPRLRLNCYGATFNWPDQGLIRWPDRAQSQIGSLARTRTLTPPRFFVQRANEGPRQTTGSQDLCSVSRRLDQRVNGSAPWEFQQAWRRVK